MNFLVTGGAGFIGSHFVELLLAPEQKGQVDRVVVLDALTYAGKRENLVSADADPRFNFIYGDVRNSDDVQRAMQDIDVVVNFAAESHVDRSISDPSDFMTTNVLGAELLLRVARQEGIKTFLQVSTDEVYGSLESGSADENYPMLPNSPYAASKAAADLICRSYFQTYGMDVRITRSTNNYGTRQYPEKLIPYFSKLAIENKNLPLYGNGQNKRDWLHVSDHCRGILLVIQGGIGGEIYNIGGGTERTNRELTLEILEFFQLGVDKIEYISDRLGHDIRYSVNDKKISKIGYTPKIELKNGLRATLTWYKEFISAPV
jgi:dTDP-glucose 4,6-dehydratase